MLFRLAKIKPAIATLWKVEGKALCLSSEQYWEAKLPSVSIAEEEILLASDPRDIREYLVCRGEKASFFDPISAETEASLFATGNRLIQLSVAEYCLHDETARAIFAGDDPLLRRLALANRAVAKGSLRFGFPECVIGEGDELVSALGALSEAEIATVFSNPSLDDRFLEGFLSMNKTWDALDEQKRIIALRNLALNEKMRAKRNIADHAEGWDWYQAGLPLTAAWALIHRLEPSAQTVIALSELLGDLPADSFKKEGIMDALPKWVAQGDDKKKEEQENERGRLSDYQEVRQAGARLLASDWDANIDEFLGHEDIAIRCGAYEGAKKLDKNLIVSVVEKDGDLARYHLIRNERLWRNQKVRDLLFDLALRGSETDEPRWEFNHREAIYRKQFPEWFDDEENAYLEPDERPLVEGSIADVVTGITNDPAMKTLQQRIAGLEKGQTWLTLMLGVALFILVSKTWF